MLDMNPNEPMLKPGDVVGDRYRIQEMVGRGSFAEVHRGLDTVLDRTVAVKVMSPSLGYDTDDLHSEMVERFRREAHMVAKLRSPYVVELYDYGSTPAGGLFMVMEFVDGLSLRELLDANGPLPQERVIPILIKTFKCLREAHNFGLLHRDIKPENLMIFDYQDEKDLVRVVDFGIAKAFLENSNQSNLTSDGVLVGTPKYVAPERVLQQQQYPASDIYSMGVVTYELLTGHDPFRGLKGMQIIKKQIDPQPITLPPEVDVHQDFRLIVDKMLCKELSDRYGTCQQLIEDLERVNVLLTYASFKGNRESAELPAFAPKTMRTPSIDMTMSRLVADSEPISDHMPADIETARTEVVDMSKALYQAELNPMPAVTGANQPVNATKPDPFNPFGGKPAHEQTAHAHIPDSTTSPNPAVDMSDDPWVKHKKLIIAAGGTTIFVLLAIIVFLLTSR